jgi:hypothetical protein
LIFIPLIELFGQSIALGERRVKMIARAGRDLRDNPSIYLVKTPKIREIS